MFSFLHELSDKFTRHKLPEENRKKYVRKLVFIQLHANYSSFFTLHYVPQYSLYYISINQLCLNTRTAGAYDPHVLAPAEGFRVLWAPYSDYINFWVFLSSKTLWILEILGAFLKFPNVGYVFGIRIPTFVVVHLIFWDWVVEKSKNKIVAL